MTGTIIDLTIEQWSLNVTLTVMSVTTMLTQLILTRYFAHLALTKLSEPPRMDYVHAMTGTLMPQKFVIHLIWMEIAAIKTVLTLMTLIMMLRI